MKFNCLTHQLHLLLSIEAVTVFLNASDITNCLITTALSFHETVGTFMLTPCLTGKTGASEFKFANAGSSS